MLSKYTTIPQENLDAAKLQAKVAVAAFETIDVEPMTSTQQKQQ